MKNISFYRVLGLFVLIFSASCSSSEDNNNNNKPVDVTAIINTAKQGTWKVTRYSDHGGNETDHFTGFTFTFGDNDALTATNGTDTYTGTWKVTGDNYVQDESPDDPVDFNIYFEGPIDFSDISDDWDIVSRSDTKIDLIDVSAEPGKKPDKITFEKN